MSPLSGRRLPERGPPDTKEFGYGCSRQGLAGFTALKFRGTPGSTPRVRALNMPTGLGEAVDPSEAG